jgi:serine/threonine-protein kinase
MTEQPRPEPTEDLRPAEDGLDAALGAAFGPDSALPVAAGGSVLQALAASLPEVPSVHLRDPERETPTPVVWLGSQEVPERPGPSGRLQLLGEIARGGMGAILKGRDTDLGRDVAVKVLLETHKGRTELVQRFVEEAQIAGQLQHPGITPVYELGQFPDARPYFTMKLVKGKTLVALLAEAAPSDQARFLKVFEQVCQTLAYAHARGVIHRDLKPSNVMVGAFGEVQVMDWGLAKVLHEGGLADEKASRERQRPAQVSVIQTQRSSGTAEVGSDTQAGSVLGTPAYMAPEQARGEVDLVDARADVFGLGAILCEILTGQPPFTGPRAEAMRKAQTAQLEDAHARLDRCGADAELIGLARQCLSREPWDRPRNAGAVAEAVTAYQQSVAERLQRAELERAAALARTEEARSTARAERRARRWLAGLSAAVLLLAAAGGWLLYQRALAVRAAEAALADVADAAARRDWPAAQLALGRAEARTTGWGFGALRQQVQRTREDLDTMTELEEIYLATLVGGPADYPGADARFAAAFQRLDIDAAKQGPAEMAERVRGRTIAVELATRLDVWAWLRRQHAPEDDSSWRTLVEAARQADDDTTRNRLRLLVLDRDRTGIKQLAKQLDPAAHSPLTLTMLGQYLRGAGDNTIALEYLRKAQRHYPDDLSLNLLLANVLFSFVEADKYRESIAYYSAAVALRPRSAGIMDQLATAHILCGEFDEGLRIAQRALELQPDSHLQAQIHHTMTMAWNYKGNYDKALAEAREAVRLDPGAWNCHQSLSRVLMESKQYDEALAECRVCIRLHSAVPAHKRRGFTEFDLLGKILLKQGKVDEALDAIQKAIPDIEHPVPKAMALHGLGNAQWAKGEREKALDSYREAVRLDPDGMPQIHALANALKQMDRLDDAIAVYREALPTHNLWDDGFNSMGRLLSDRGRLLEAEAAFRMAGHIKPKNANYRYNLGLVLNRMKRYPEAVDVFREALKLDKKFADAYVDLGITLRHLAQMDKALEAFHQAVEVDAKAEARAQIGIGNVMILKNDPKAALAAFERSIKLDANSWEAHDNKGLTLLGMGRVDDAIAAHRTALELKGPPHVRTNLANALLLKGDLKEALVVILESVAANPNDARTQYLHGRILLNLRQLDEAAQAFRQAIRLAPFFAAAHVDLGAALKGQGRFTESLAEYQTGHDLGTRLPDWNQPSDVWLREAETQVVRSALLDAALKGEWKPAGAEERIAFGQAAKLKKRFAAAARLYELAFTEQPQLAEQLRVGHRYDAACYAALAGCGQGQDADKLDDKERIRLRTLALDWLRADVKAWQARLEQGNPEARKETLRFLRHWQTDADLVGIRDQSAVAKLPAEERAAFQSLWADVEALVQKAAAGK